MKGITKEDVAGAIQELRGKNMGCESGDILALLGTGSKTTITKYRNEFLAEEQAPKTEIPAPLMAAISTAWSSQCRKTGEEAMAMSDARVTLAEKKAEAATAELDRANAKVERLEDLLIQERKENGTIKTEVKALRRQLEKRSSELEQMRGQLKLIETQQKSAIRRKGGAN